MRDTSVGMKMAGWYPLSMVFAVVLTACPTKTEVASLGLDATVPDYTKLPGDSDKKGLINNLIGRWYPDSEIKRLDDDTMVPEAWCARPPTKIQVKTDEVIVQCDNQDLYVAAIARAEPADEGGIRLTLRAKQDAKMKTIHFHEVWGPRAKISGTPCYDKVTDYARFPKFETLQRQILNGKRCAAVIAEQKMIE